MRQHDYSYDYLRAFAAIMIVFCHIFQGFNISVGIGYYLGGTYVDVFLLLSAYLLGKSSRNTIAYRPWHFMKKRGGRLIPTYYTYLTITFLIIVFFLGLGSLSFKQVVAHYTFMNWFWPASRIADYPLPQIGHLWFMSCILFGYISVVVWSQLLKRIPPLDTKKSWVAYFVIVAIITTALTSKIRMAVYPFTVILGFSLLFFRGIEIMNYIRRVQPAILVSLLVIGNVGAVLYYLFGGYDYPAIIFWINILNACLWIATAPIIFRRDKITKLVSFLSAISFEIYLVHHPFCLGAYSIVQYMPIWLAIICVLAIAIAGGWLLSVTTSALLSIQRNILRKKEVV